jgi:hypothetical protein
MDLVDYKTLYFELKAKHHSLEKRVVRLLMYFSQDRTCIITHGSIQTIDIILYLMGLNPHLLDGIVPMNPDKSDYLYYQE